MTPWEEKAVVFDIEKFAVHDGPGIRTVIFLKGCPLHCLWCHNPESQSFRPELLFHSGKCTLCGKCVSLCPEHAHTIEKGEHRFDRTKCRLCGLCAENCPGESLNMAGREMSVNEVMEQVLKDLVFYRNSGGGITLSGGEPLARFEFSLSLLRAAKEAGIHTAVETGGFAPWEHIERLLPFVDLWLWDVKASREKHERLTGVPADPIRENLKKLDQASSPVFLRCPLVPNVNDFEEDLSEIAKLANECAHVQEIDLEPYHPLGEGKSRALGRSVFHAPFASDADKKRWKEFLSARTKVPIHI